MCIRDSSYEKHLDKIFEEKILSEDISYYLHRPSATDPNMAPKNQDAFYVLVPVPNNLSNINWSEEGEKFKNLILDKMDRSVLPGIKQNVVSDFYLTPDYFEKDLACFFNKLFFIEIVYIKLLPMREHRAFQHLGVFLHQQSINFYKFQIDYEI